MIDDEAVAAPEPNSSLPEISGLQVQEDEVDAESISSHGSSSASKVGLPVFFRFHRGGLFIEFSFKENSPLNAPYMSSDPSGIRKMNKWFMVDFEECCRVKYKDETRVGDFVDRYTDPPGYIHQVPSNAAAPGSSLNNAPVPISAAPLLQASNVELGTSQTTTPAAPSSNLKSNLGIRGSEDRLTAVITDVLHRLNRQGVLADPREVCKSGGGKTGEFYERDEDFFDDSEVFQQLGFGSGPSDESEVDVSSSEDDLSQDTDGGSELSDASSEEDPFSRAYDCCDPGEFRLDNNIEDDFQFLKGAAFLVDDPPVVEESQTDEDTVMIAENKNINRLVPNVVDESHWVRPRRWRKHSEGLPEEIVTFLIELERDLSPMGTAHGLLVTAAEVIALLQERISQLFRKIYPNLGERAQIMSLLTNTPLSSWSSDVESSSPIASTNSQLVCSPESYSLKNEETWSAFCPLCAKQLELGPDDLIDVHWQHLDRLVTCLTRMTSAITERQIFLWWQGRLAMYNQIVFNSLEDKLLNHIVNVSPFLRRKLSVIQAAFKSADNRVSERNEESTNEEQQESPFAPIGPELVNWTVVYNQRRNELKNLLDSTPLDTWPPNPFQYISDILNEVFINKFKGLKGQRLITPKMVEIAVRNFKTEFGLPHLSERRRKKWKPFFALPCSGFQVLKTRGKRRRTEQTSAKRSSEVKLVNSLDEETSAPKKRRQTSKQHLSLIVSKVEPEDNNTVDHLKEISSEPKPGIDNNSQGESGEPKSLKESKKIDEGEAPITDVDSTSINDEGKTVDEKQKKAIQELQHQLPKQPPVHKQESPTSPPQQQQSPKQPPLPQQSPKRPIPQQSPKQPQPPLQQQSPSQQPLPQQQQLSPPHQLLSFQQQSSHMTPQQLQQLQHNHLQQQLQQQAMPYVVDPAFVGHPHLAAPAILPLGYQPTPMTFEAFQAVAMHMQQQQQANQQQYSMMWPVNRSPQEE